MLDTKKILATQEVIITIHTYHQCSGTVHYVVSPGIPGKEKQGDDGLNQELDYRFAIYRAQGYEPQTLYVVSTVK